MANEQSIPAQKNPITEVANQEPVFHVPSSVLKSWESEFDRLLSENARLQENISKLSDGGEGAATGREEDRRIFAVFEPRLEHVNVHSTHFATELEAEAYLRTREEGCIIYQGPGRNLRKGQKGFLVALKAPKDRMPIILSTLGFVRYDTAQ